MNMTEGRANHGIDPMSLSYQQGMMSLDKSGRILSKEKKAALREQNGYCLTCPGIPVRLYEVKKSRLNPLWSQRQACSVDGESHMGKCLRCTSNNKNNITRQPSLSRDSSESSTSSTTFSSMSTRAQSPHRNVIRTDSNRSVGRKSPKPRNALLASSGSSSRSLNLRSQSRTRSQRSMEGQRHNSGRSLGARLSSNPVAVQTHNLTDRLTSESQSGRIAPETNNIHLSGISSHSHRSSLSSDQPSTSSVGSEDNDRRAAYNRGNSVQSLLSICSVDEDLPVAAQNSEDEAVLENLTALFGDMMSTGEGELITDVIVNALDSHIQSDNVQIFCLQHVTEAVDCDTFLNAAGHVRIFRAMNTFPSSAAIHTEACRALATMCASNTARKILLQDGICDQIDKTLLRFLGEETMAEFAIQVLRSLSFEAGGSSSLIRLDIPTKVVEVMQCNMGSAGVQRDGCALLSNLSVDVEKQEVSVVDRNMISVIVECMSHHENDPSVLASACFALKNLTYAAPNVVTLARTAGVLEVLTNATGFGPCAADAELVTERTHMQMAEDQSLEDHLVGTIQSMIAASQDDPNVVGDIVDIFKENTWSQRTSGEALQALESLAERDSFRDSLKRNRLAILRICSSRHVDCATRDRLRDLVQ